MKVNDPNLGGIGSNGVGKSQESSAVGGATRVSSQKTEASSSDSVQLSSLSKQISSLSEESPEHAARLERLAAEVESGRYSVDPQEVAARMIDDSIKAK